MNLWQVAEQVFGQISREMQVGLRDLAERPGARGVRVTQTGLDRRVAAVVTAALETFNPPPSGAVLRIERVELPDGSFTVAVHVDYGELP